MTIDWFSYAAQLGRDPGSLRPLWHEYRARVFWFLRTSIIVSALLLCLFSGSLMTHRLLMGQSPQLERLEERFTAFSERVTDHEIRIRYLERDVLARLAAVEAVVRQNTEDIHKVMWTSFGSLAGIAAFLAKEFLRLLQERKK
jgi:hypothetical protein